MHFPTQTSQLSSHQTLMMANRTDRQFGNTNNFAAEYIFDCRNSSLSSNVKQLLPKEPVCGVPDWSNATLAA